VMFTGMSSGVPHVRSGRLKGLAVSGDQRSAIAPEIPTVAESGLKEFSFMTWYGVLAPAATPPDIVDRLSKEIRKALESPEVKDQFVKLGVEGAPSTPEDFGRFLGRESAHYQHIIKLTGAKGE